jgi:hypothetical protein
MSSPWKFVSALPAKLPPPDPSPSESLETMEESVQQSPVTPQPVDDPVLPCQKDKKWLELTVVGPDGEPIANAPCKLLIPEGNGMQGTTDKSGFVRFDGIYADPMTFRLDISLQEGPKPSWNINVVPRTAPSGPDKKTATEEPDVRYVVVPWDDRDIRSPE